MLYVILFVGLMLIYFNIFGLMLMLYCCCDTPYYVAGVMLNICYCEMVHVILLV